MENPYGFLILFALVFAVAAALSGTPVIIDMLASRKRRVLMVKRGTSTPAANDTLSRFVKGAPLSHSKIIAFLLSHGFWRGRITALVNRCRSAGIDCAAEQLLASLVCSACGGGILGLVVFGSPLPAMAVASASCSVLPLMITRRARTSEKLMRTQVPDALHALEVSLGAGRSLPQALEYVAQVTKAPLGKELKGVSWDMQAGVPFDASMDSLRKRTGIEELSIVAVAMSVQHRTGGSLKPILASSISSLKETFAAEHELVAQTSQAKLSARIVAAMPFVLLLALAIISPSYVTAFFTGAVGMSLFVLALLLDLAGLVCIRRILDIEV